jgi:hypothetical protein
MGRKRFLEKMSRICIWMLLYQAVVRLGDYRLKAEGQKRAQWGCFYL